MSGDTDGWIPAVERLPVEPDTDLDDSDVELQSRGWNPFARSAARVRELHLDPALLQRSLDDITAKLEAVLATQNPQPRHGFTLESFTVGLAVSATGKVFLVADAGLEASIELTFTRRPPPEPPGSVVGS